MPACPYAAITSHLSISGRVVPGRRAAKSERAMPTAESTEPYPTSLGNSEPMTSSPQHPAEHGKESPGASANQSPQEMEIGEGGPPQPGDNTT